MKDFLQSIFKSTEERIKNPFVGAFVTSWIIFNWKPILYLLFSDEKIKTKIEYISKEASGYTSIWTVVWFPLFSAIFYILILPFLSFLFEYILKYAMKWRNKVNLESRNDVLELQIGVAKNEIKLEEEKTAFRERSSHNQMVENLQDQINYLNLALDEANNSHLEVSNKLIEQINKGNKEQEKLTESFTNQTLILDEKLDKERRNNLIKDRTLENIVLENKSLNTQLKVRNFQLSRLQNTQNKVLKFDDRTVLEYFTENNEIIYFDVNRLELIDVFTISKMFSEFEVIGISTDDEVSYAVDAYYKAF